MVFVVKERRRREWKNPRAISRKGKREDLGGQYFRSNQEANLARVFNHLGVRWQYEPKEFEFPVPRGNRFYTPDFYLPDLDRWVEVKGWLDEQSLTKLRRFKKYYPDEFKKLQLYISTDDKKTMAAVLGLGCEFFGLFKKAYSMIENWE